NPPLGAMVRHTVCQIYSHGGVEAAGLLHRQRPPCSVSGGHARTANRFCPHRPGLPSPPRLTPFGRQPRRLAERPPHPSPPDRSVRLGVKPKSKAPSIVV